MSAGQDRIALRDAPSVAGLRARYALGVALLLLLLLGVFCAIDASVASGRQEGRLIDLAGRQRMLSQRLAATLLERSEASSDRPRVGTHALNATASEFVGGHIAVRDRSFGVTPMGEHSLRVVSLFADIEPLFQSITRQLDSADAIDRTALAELLTSTDRYLTRMDAIVGVLSAEWDAKIERRRETTGWLFALSGLATLLVSATVFEPVLRGFVRSRDRLLERSTLVDEKQREAESTTRSLRESVRFNQAILETAADGIVVIDRSGKIMLANPSAHRMFGRPAGTLPGVDVTDLMDDYDRVHHSEYVSAYEQTGRSSVIGSTREVVGRRQSGERFPIDLSVAVMEWDGKRAYTGFLRDVSERQRLQDRLTQAEKLESLGRLAAGLAHEINTPLQFIMANTQYLDSVAPEIESSLAAGGLQRLDERTIRTLDRLRCAVNDNLEGVGRVAEILDAMKGFSHPGEREKTMTSLNSCVRSTVTISRNRWKQAATVELQLEPGLPEVLGYPAEINQALLNLVVNAADAISESQSEQGQGLGQITIRTWSDDEAVSVAVEDDGTGIPEEVLPQIFDQFFTTKTVGEGTGQGLAIAHSVASEMHGGSLVAENQFGGGARFVMTLPLQPAQERRLVNEANGERCPMRDPAVGSTA